ncbi:tRNA-splicing endonuclease [Acrasis kona]|uniref:tRNA-splicing endonuclease n=1 Tax=Acrasis kona TaxID=1008807 RepID=A0AAW2ZI14_9EUKA
MVPNDVIEYILLFIVDDDRSWAKCRLVSSDLKEVVDNYRLKNISVRDKDSGTIVEYTFYQGLPGKYYVTLDYENYSTYETIYHRGVNDSRVVTVWHKIRVDPETLLVENNDFTYTTRTGYCEHHRGRGHVATTSIPYGCAFDCSGPYSNTGKALIDLRNTPFCVDDAFENDGWQSNGSSDFQNKNQVVHLTGGGYCGWICPKLADTEEKAVMGGWYLQLNVKDNILGEDANLTNASQQSQIWINVKNFGGVKGVRIDVPEKMDDLLVQVKNWGKIQDAILVDDEVNAIQNVQQLTHGTTYFAISKAKYDEME